MIVLVVMVGVAAEKAAGLRMLKVLLVGMVSAVPVGVGTDEDVAALVVGDVRVGINTEH